MKATTKILVLFVFMALVLSFPKAALAAGTNPDDLPDQFVFGGNFTLESGDTLDGGLVVFGGNATIETDSTVQGDVLVMGGNLYSEGTVEGNVVIFGGHAELGDTALVEGDLVTLGGSLDRAPGAVIEGNVSGELPEGFLWNGGPVIVPSIPQFPSYSSRMVSMPGLWGGLSWLWAPFAILTMAAMAMIITMFWPKHVQRVSGAVMDAPLPSGGIGCLTVIALPIILIAMVFTCVGILFIPVVAIAVGILGLLGWTAIGLEIGKRIAIAVKREWDPAVSAGLGVLLLTIVTTGLDLASRAFWPLSCVAWVIPTVIGLVSLGAALLTRFGTRMYPLEATDVSETEEPVAELPEPEDVEAEPVEIEEPEESQDEPSGDE